MSGKDEYIQWRGKMVIASHIIDDKTTVGVSDGNDNFPLEVVSAAQEIVLSQARKKELSMSDADVHKVSHSFLRRLTSIYGPRREEVNRDQYEEVNRDQYIHWRGKMVMSDLDLHKVSHNLLRRLTPLREEVNGDGNEDAKGKTMPGESGDAAVSHRNLSRYSSLSLSSMHASVHEEGPFDAPSMASANLDKVFDTFGEELDKATGGANLADISTAGAAVDLLAPPEAESVYTLSSHRSLVSHDTDQSMIDAFVAGGDFKGLVLAAATKAETGSDARSSDETSSTVTNYYPPSLRKFLPRGFSRSLSTAEIRAEMNDFVRWVVPEEIENVDEITTTDPTPLLFDTPFFDTSALPIDQPEPELKDLKPTQETNLRLRPRRISWKKLKCRGGETGLKRILAEVGESRVEYQTEDDSENGHKGDKGSNAGYDHYRSTSTEQNMRYQALSDVFSTFTKQSEHANATRLSETEHQPSTLSEIEDKTPRNRGKETYILKNILKNTFRVLRKSRDVRKSRDLRKASFVYRPSNASKELIDLSINELVASPKKEEIEENEIINYLDMEDVNNSYRSKDWSLSAHMKSIQLASENTRRYG